jgi:hypothetical protein
MGVVLRFCGHKLNVGLCENCGGIAGTLPTDCPGEIMDDTVEACIYEGTLDFRRREGWVRRPSKAREKAWNLK